MTPIALHSEDFYKISHFDQLPEKTQLIYSNLTPRSSKLANMPSTFDEKVVFIGLQGVMKWLLIDQWNKTFFRKKKERVLKKFTDRCDRALGPGSVTLDHVAELHDLGYLPIEIRALAEGSRVNIRVPYFTIKNTDPRFAWIVNFLETQLSAELWKTSTNATIAYEYRKVLDLFAELTGSPAEFVSWQGHDFSMRGMSGIHDAAQSGVGHLASFYGTDTVPALDYLDQYYSGRGVPVLGGSVPASEHSCMSLGGKESEIETFRRMIRVYPTGVFSVVSDTWDFWNVVTNIARELKPEIMARRPDALGLAKVVFRPDSGDPVKIICGRKFREFAEMPNHADLLEAVDDNVEIAKIHGVYREIEQYDENNIVLGKEVSEPEVKGAVECLWEVFGGTTTDKGFKLLDSHVGLIYGDSITLHRATAILNGLADKKFASANIVFGIGSFTYQMNSRDTFGHAVKATYAIVDGEARELSKDPITDNGTKKSAVGLLRVEKSGDDFILHDRQTPEQEQQGELKQVFLNGKITRKTSIKKIRKLLHGNKL